MLKNKKKLFTIIAICSASALIIAAIVYFFIVPASQINQYKSATAAQQKLSDATNKLIAVQSNDAFTKSEVESLVLRDDIKNGREAIKDIESALDANGASLTNFSALPLLDFNASYKSAIDLKTQEQAYQKSVRDYTEEMRACLDYLEKSTDMRDSLAAAMTSLQNVTDTTSAETLVATINDVSAKLDTAIAQIEALTPPESFKEWHDTDLALGKELSGTFKQMSAAITAVDLQKIDSLNAQYTKSAADSAAKTAELSKKFINDSKLSRLGASVKNQQRSIEATISKL